MTTRPPSRRPWPVGLGVRPAPLPDPDPLPRQCPGGGRLRPLGLRPVPLLGSVVGAEDRDQRGRRVLDHPGRRRTGSRPRPPEPWELERQAVGPHPGGPALRPVRGPRHGGQEVYEGRMRAAELFVAHNRLNRSTVDPPMPPVGFVGRGQDLLRPDRRPSTPRVRRGHPRRRAGDPDLFKPAVLWPWRPGDSIREFATGLDTDRGGRGEAGLHRVAGPDALYGSARRPPPPGQEAGRRIALVPRPRRDGRRHHRRPTSCGPSWSTGSGIDAVAAGPGDGC